MPAAPDPSPDPLPVRAWRRLLDAGAPDWLQRHARAVAGLTVAFCDAAERQGLEPDRALAVAGALLHDLGRTRVQDVRHASTGAQMLQDDGPDAWDPRLVRIVDRHTGAGIDAAEAAALHLPVRDYTPKSLEERIVAHADNLFTGDRRLRLADLREKYLAKRLGAAWSRIAALHASLGAELGADLETLPAQDVPGIPPAIPFGPDVLP